MEFRSLDGAQPYEAVRRLQLELVQARIADEIPDTVLMLEHSPVVTRGRGLQWGGTGVETENTGARHMPLGFLPAGVAFAESERGGDLTFHGPGQLVVYPILKLDGRNGIARHDLNAFLRILEALLDPVLAEAGLTRSRRESATGIWVETHAGPRKIASIGVAVRKWVTYHGVAINGVNDLSPFHSISPCGFSPEVMARLVDLSPAFAQTWQSMGWRAWLESRIRARFVELQVTRL